MDLAALEFPAIVDRLAAATGTPHGEELGVGARAVGRRGRGQAPPGVDRRGGRAARCVGRTAVRGDPGRTSAGRAGLARRRAQPEALRAVASTVGGGLRVRSALGSEAPLLAALLDAVDPGLAALADEIDRRVEEDGSGVRDTASPAPPPAAQRAARRARSASPRSWRGSPARPNCASTSRRRS